MKKHLLLFLLSAVFTLVHAQVNTWDGTASAWNKGTGTKQDPYLIESAANLAYLSQQVASGNSYSHKHFRLSVDLDLNNLEWTPVGGRSPQGAPDNMFGFGGIFDGNGKTVTKLKIDSPDKKFTALFGSVSDALNPGIAQVCNLHIGSGSIKGLSGTAGIAGFLSGTIKGCTNAAEIHADENGAGVAGSASEGSQINGCSNSGNISGANVAGIVYSAEKSLLRNCKNSGRISAEGVAAGIIASLKGGTIMDCRNEAELSGNTAAGIIDNISGNSSGILRCSNSGKVTAKPSASGILNTAKERNSTIIDCYNTGEITAEENAAAGIVSQDSPGSISYCYNTGTISGTGHVGAIVARFDESITLSNCFYLDSSVQTPDPNATAKTEQEMQERSLVSLFNKDRNFPCWKAGDQSNNEFPQLILIPYFVTLEAQHVTATSAILKARLEPGENMIVSTGFVVQAAGEERGQELDAEIINDSITVKATCQPNTEYVFSIYVMDMSGIHLGDTHTFKTPDGSAIENKPVNARTAAYPNPVRGLLHIPLLGGNDANQSMLRIYNPAGQCVTEIHLGNSSEEITVDTTGFPTGTYIYRCGEVNGKFTVE